MAEQVAGVQHKLLRWAREKAGLSLSDVAGAMKKDVEVIKAWEEGEQAPTYVQLEKLAYQLYKRPIAIFFFPEPPPEVDAKTAFRTLPEIETESLPADVRYALRSAQAMQLALSELNDGVNPTERKIFADIELTSRTDMVHAASRVRSYLGVDIEEQSHWKAKEIALDAWRRAVEAVGIFVFRQPMKESGVSGFSLDDKQFPVIYLNSSDFKARQIFSIFHELGHILFHMSGVTKADDRYIDFLPKNDQLTEQLCNKFAGECLVPSADFTQRVHSKKVTDDLIDSLADRYKVSHEVILRKLLDRGLIDRAAYHERVEQRLKVTPAKQKGGGDYYKNQASYLGPRFLELVFGKYYQGRISIEQVADYFGIKTRSVSGLEHVFMRKAATR